MIYRHVDVKEKHSLDGERVYDMKLHVKITYTAQKIFHADLVTFTEEICNGKLHFLCSVT